MDTPKDEYDLSVSVDGPYGITRMRRTWADGGLGEALTLMLIELAEKRDEPALARITEAAYRELQAIRDEGIAP